MNSNKTTYLSSLNKELHSIMESNPEVILIGEDISDPYGGAFKATKGISSRFPERTFTTPVSEAGLVGTAIGLSMRGFRPVAEIMFGDFLMLAADQLINHAAKFRWVYNDKIRLQLVVRTPVGGRRGYGPTHSQCLEKHFIGVPGLFVVAPNLISEPGKILRQAILDCEDPVLFIESKISYGKPVLDSVPDMTIEVYSDEKARFPSTYLHHNGAGSTPDGVLFCYGEMVPICLEAVEYLKDNEGLYIDIAAISQISPPPATHIRSILEARKPGLCVYAEESSVTGGWSSEMLAVVEEIVCAQKEAAQIRHVRIGSKYTPIPCSRELETFTLPQVEDITQSILNCF